MVHLAPCRAAAQAQPPDSCAAANPPPGNHTLYADEGIACAECHPCGKKLAGGHAASWMDPAAAGFHAPAANAGLDACKPCHGTTLDGAGMTVTVHCAQCHGPSWRTDCVMCHGGLDGPGGAPPKPTWGNGSDPVRVGAHTAHLAAAHALASPVACGECHVVPAEALTAGHVDGSPAEVVFGARASQGASPPPSWSRASATCAGTYCHGATLGAGGAVTAPVWTVTDGSPRACGACHGAPPPSPHPVNPSCGECHPGYREGGVKPATHVDGKLDLVAMACNTCHGSSQSSAPPRGTGGETSTATLAVGAHQAHVAGGALAAPIGCDTCHPVPSSSSHSDSAVQIAWGGISAVGGTSPRWDRQAATCSATYCHGAFPGGNLVNAPSWITVDGSQDGCGSCHGAPPPAPHVQNPECGGCHSGYGPGLVNLATHVDGKIDVNGLSCTTCHGSAQSAAPPLGTRGETETTSRAVGAHQRHVAGGALRRPIDCAECHPLPPTTDHADATVELAFGPLAGGASASFDPATLTCTTYCHGATLAAGGTNVAPLWTRVDGTQAACGTCHGAPPPAPHSGNTVCGMCHDGYTATTVNLVTHVDGKVDARPLSCSACHGSPESPAPPAGTHGESSATERAVGAHERHLAGGALAGPVACTECHLVPTAMDHADGAVQLAFGPLARSGGATPAFDGAALTCSSTYCHGATLRGGGANQAPVWTGGPAETFCGSCHATPPPAPHVHTQECGNCHPGYTLTTVNLATHLDGVVDAENLTCSSCHGDNSRVLAMAADPLAIAAPPFGSRGEADPASRSVGQHVAHVNRGNGLALPNKCRYCHAVPTSFTHANGVSEVAFDSLARMDGAQPTFDGTTCSNTYCHGSTLGRGGTDHAPRWTDPTAVTCTSCHGAPPPQPHPQDSDCIRCHPGYTATSVRKTTHVNGVSDFPSGCNSCHDVPPASGEHYEHLHHGIACAKCHAGYTTTSENPALHRNAVQDVTLSGWNASRRTCSNISCHGSEYWGRSGTATRQSCNQCHGVPPDSGEHFEHSEYACSRCHGTGYSTTTVNTSTHMSNVVDVPFSWYDRANLRCSRACHDSKSWGQRKPVTPNCGNCHGFPPSIPHPQDSACQSCHPSMLSSGVLTEQHNNGLLDVAGEGCQSCHGFPPTSTGTGAIHPADSNCYGCHSVTVDAQNRILPDGSHNDGYVQVGGGGVGTYGCQSCHGDQARTIVSGADANAKAAPPVGTRGETEPTTRAVGAHEAHLNRSAAAGAIAPPAACAECHTVPTAMDHANGQVVNVFGGRAVLDGASPTLDPVALTCASTYCHGATLNAGGTNHAPHWNGGSAEAACGTCHGAPPPEPHTRSTACEGCHDGYTEATVNVATHVDGKVDYSAAACNACHGSGANAAPPAGTKGETATTARAVGAHQAHVNAGPLAGAYACEVCHPVPASAKHSDQVVQLAWGALASAGGATPSFDPAALTCSNYCHGATLPGGSAPAPLWTRVDGTQAACGACHGAPPPLPHSQNPSCGSCHEGYGAATVNLAVHVDGKLDVLPMTCTSCHGAGSDPAPPVGTLGETAATTVAVGAHQAHLDGGTLAGPIACGECHLPPTALDHADGTAQVAFGTLAKTGGAGPAWDRTTATCTASYCHGQFAGGNLLAAPLWTGGPSQAACGACHGAPPPAPHSAGTACGSCHPGYTQTSVNLATHVNGQVEATTYHPAGWKDRTQHGYQSSLGGLAGCKSCHGADLAGGTSGVSCTGCHASAGYASWDTNCTFCHGSTATGRQNPPVDIQGRTAATNVSVGVHESHATTTIASFVACAECHPARTASVVTDAAHVDGNGIAEVSFGALAKTGAVTPVYTRVSATSATCASTYCHGKFSGGTSATPSWTSTTQVTCTSCHGNPPSSGRHSTHSGRASCYNCHNGVVNSTNGFVDKSLHVNGVDNVKFGGTRSWGGTITGTWTASTRRCSNLSCHGSEYW